MKTTYTALISLVLVILSGCSKKKTDPPASTTDPGKAVLTTPANNAPCIQGANAANGQSAVTLQWTASANTDSYEVSIKNLLTQAETKQSTSQTQVSVTLAQNTPYSWKVTSKNSKSSTTAVSETWKFYNTGAGVTNHPPFPAEATTPAMGASVNPTGGTVTLSWTAADADGASDLKEYDIYIGTGATLPATPAKANHNTSAYAAAVTANTTYYWKVVTRDQQGNTSVSPVWSFKTN